MKNVRESPIFLKDKFDTINPYNQTMLHKSSSNPLTSFRENIFFPLYENVASRMKVLEEKTKAYGKNQTKGAIFEIHGSHSSLND